MERKPVLFNYRGEGGCLYTVYLCPPRLARIHNFSKSNFLRVSSRHLYLKFNLLAAGQTEKKRNRKEGFRWPQSTRRVAMATFWRTFHHDGRIIPAPFAVSTITYRVVVYTPAERADHRAHRVAMATLSVVHSIMMEQWTQPGEGWGCAPAPFQCIYHHVQSCCVRSSWECRYTHPISTLYLYVLCGTDHGH